MFFQRYVCDATLVIRAPVRMKGRRWGTPWQAAAGGRGLLKRRTKSSRYPSGNFLSTGILFLWYILLWYSKSMVLLNG